VETILEKDNFTLEELLDEEDLLQECKSQNQKLLDYLLRVDTLDKLLFYLTNDPPENAPSKQRQKYPYLACEILCLEVWDICDAIYDNSNLLDRLWGFLDLEPPLSPLTASYICRVAAVLLQRKVSESFAYLKTKETIVKSFLTHIGNASVNELLLKLIQCEETQEGNGVVEWMSEQNLIGLLVEKLHPGLPSVVHENAGQALVDIISSPSNTRSLLVEQLQSETTFQQLFDFINTGGSKSSLFWSLQVIIDVVRRESGEGPQEYKNTPFEDLPLHLQVCGKNLKVLVNVLQENNGEQLPTSVGVVVPIGTHRLKVIDFFSALLQNNYECLDSLFVDLGVFKVCLHMFFNYFWNNFLHLIVTDMVITFLSTRSPELALRLMDDAELVNQICHASDGNNADLDKPNGYSRGYMGFVTRISNKLVELSQTEKIGEYLSGNANWQKYVQEDLPKQNSEQEILLGGQKPNVDDPNQSSSGDDDQGHGMANNELVNVFTQYLVRQGYTNDIPKDFLAEDYEEEGGEDEDEDDDEDVYEHKMDYEDKDEDEDEDEEEEEEEEEETALPGEDEKEEPDAID